MDNQEINQGRRRFLTLATAGAGGLAAAGVAAPFVASFFPSEKAKAAGAAVEIDISKIESGQMLTAEWRGKPIWVVNRTEQQLKDLPTLDGNLVDPKSETEQQPANCQNDVRSIKPQIWVAVGICTHLGCSPDSKFKEGGGGSLPEAWPGGYLCPCHGSTFDLAGRVFKNKPAPNNLDVPRYMFVSDTKIIIGKDEKGEA